MQSTVRHAPCAVLLHRQHQASIAPMLCLQENHQSIKKEDLCDGVIGGHPYFTCSPGRGIITSVNKIKLNIEQQVQADQIMKAREATPSMIRPMESAVDVFTDMQAGSYIDASGYDMLPRHSSDPASGLEKGKVVLVRDRDEPTKKHRGKVDWVGEKTLQGQTRQYAKLRMVRLCVCFLCSHHTTLCCF